MSSEKLQLDICLSPRLLGNYNLDNTAIVIIDIVRASTTICTAISYGVEHIIALDDVDATKKLKNDGYLIAGERDGEQLEGFDLGNSPISFMDRKMLEGSKIAMTTTNGTHTLKIATEAASKYSNTEILIGAFVNYSKLRQYLAMTSRNVLLVCSGWKGNLSIEDTIFAGKMADDLMRYGKFDYLTDAPNHALMVYTEAKSNLFDFIMDYSMRFRAKASLLSQDIRYSVKQDAAEVLPVLENGKIVNKLIDSEIE
jgi:2-phosphosulfolactate phosphatase